MAKQETAASDLDDSTLLPWPFRSIVIFVAADAKPASWPSYR